MKKLITQFVKFGIVGFLAFCIDYGLFLLLDLIIDYRIAATISFVISTIFNYICSMRYVFVSRTDQSSMRAFSIFFILSLVGLGLNVLILWSCVDVLAIPAWFGKLVATAVVMVFNFITRKIFLEEKNTA